MRLSEAILAGSVLAKPRPGRLHRPDGFACALGMGELAMGKKSDETRGTMFDMEYAHLWPWTALIGRNISCPVPNCNPDGRGPDVTNCYAGIIAHIFDFHVCAHDWQLEELCDWVRSVEPAEDDIPARMPSTRHDADGWVADPSPVVSVEKS